MPSSLDAKSKSISIYTTINANVLRDRHNRQPTQPTTDNRHNTNKKLFFIVFKVIAIVIIIIITVFGTVLSSHKRSAHRNGAYMWNERRHKSPSEFVTKISIFPEMCVNSFNLHSFFF